MHADIDREVWIDMPKGDPDYREGVCAKLVKTVYGLKTSGSAFELFSDEVASGLGFEIGDWSPTLCYHAEKMTALWRHGDD